MNFDRTIPVFELVEAWNAEVAPEFRQEKYVKMATSPFVFYRGTNHLFWRDFAGEARLARFGGAETWLQGDLHVENFGAFTNDRGEVVYSVNDFDEAVFADYQYDVWRMAISLGLALEGQFPLVVWEKGVAIFAEAYLERLARLDEDRKLKKGEFDRKNTQGELKKFLESVEKENRRAKLLAKWTVPGTGQFDLMNVRLAPVSEDCRAALCAAMDGYVKTLAGAGKKLTAAQLQVKDVAVRLNAGTGSLGTPRYYLLIEGKKGVVEDDVILDVKRQSLPSALAYLGKDVRGRHAQGFAHEAERAANAYRAMTHNTDDYLGWMLLADGSYLVRERTFVKEAFPLDKLKDEKAALTIAEQWGQILATIHARAARGPGEAREKSFEASVMALTQKRRRAFEGLVCEVAVKYVAQVKADWVEFVENAKK